jgi:hypothetical protein
MTEQFRPVNMFQLFIPECSLRTLTPDIELTNLQGLARTKIPGEKIRLQMDDRAKRITNDWVKQGLGQSRT